MIENQVAEVLASLPPRISDVVKPWAERCPDHPALVESSGAWSYTQLALRVSEAQTWLQNLGVRAGDRVMIVCENSRAFVAILLAVVSIDAWPVLVNARLSAPEVDKIRDHSGARLALYTTSVSPHAAQHANRHGAVIAEQAGLGVIGVSAKNENTEPEALDRDVANRVAALIYTSGTTGLPKGVMLTHRGLLFVAAISARIRSLAPADRLYGVLPMSHAVGLSVVLLGTLLSGGTLYLSPRFDPKAALTVIENDRLTILLGTPSMFSLLLDYIAMKGLRPLRFPELRIISSSGAPLQLTLKSAVEKAFGLPLHNGYGITECSPNISQTRLETRRTDTSVGRMLPGMESRLVGTDGQNVADGDVGELWVRGPNIMKGYYRAPDETAAAVNSEGWFNTRDLARMEDGHLFIVGRTRELIVRFGLNVYPAEVEAALNTHPSVARSAVIGRAVRDAEGGEELVAFVQPTPGSSLQATELVNHLAEYLAPYKRPSHILLVSTMPVTLTGKVMKNELAKLEQARFHHDSVV